VSRSFVNWCSPSTPLLLIYLLLYTARRAYDTGELRAEHNAYSVQTELTTPAIFRQSARPQLCKAYDAHKPQSFKSTPRAGATFKLQSARRKTCGAQAAHHLQSPRYLPPLAATTPCRAIRPIRSQSAEPTTTICRAQRPPSSEHTSTIRRAKRPQSSHPSAEITTPID
jgi:hypothetical protein